MKLTYEEITPCSEEEVRPVWLAMLNHPKRHTTRFDRVQVEEAVKAGKELHSLLSIHFLETFNLQVCHEICAKTYGNFCSSNIYWIVENARKWKRRLRIDIEIY